VSSILIFFGFWFFTQNLNLTITNFKNKHGGFYCEYSICNEMIMGDYGREEFPSTQLGTTSPMLPVFPLNHYHYPIGFDEKNKK